MSDDRDTTAPPDPGLERLSALVDGELTPPEHEAAWAALAHDQQAAARVSDYQRQRSALRALFPLRDDERYLIVRARPSSWRRAALALGWLAVGVALGIGAARLPDFGAARADPWAFARHADQAYAVFAPEQRHPVEVPATEQAHLVAWLSRRLSRTLTVPALDAYGYQLVGGRLLAGANGPAAQLMYQNPAGERLTLYITAASPQQAEIRVLGQDGRRTFYWAMDGAGYALSGQRSEPRLREIAADVCSSLGGHPQDWR